MYLIKWIENGESKSFRADSHWERVGYEEQLTERNIEFTTDPL